MARQELGFNVTALDRASQTFVKLAEKVDKLGDRLDKVDRQKVEVTATVNTQRAESALDRLSGSLSRVTGGVTGVLTSLGKLGKAGPIVLGALAAAAVAASGAIVALSSAAAVAAGGIGSAFAGIAIGATLYAQTARGEQALKQFKRQARAILSTAAAPLFDSFTRTLNRVQGLLAGLAPEMRVTFTRLGAVVNAFSRRAVSALAIIGPALGAVTRAGSAFFAALSSSFRVIARDLEPALRRLAPTLRVVARLMGQRLGAMVADLLPRIVDLGRRALPLLISGLRGAWFAVSALVAIGNFFVNTLGFMITKVNRVRIALNKMALRVLKLGDIFPGTNFQLNRFNIKARIADIRATNAAVASHFWGDASNQLTGRLGGLTGAVGRAAGRTTVFGTRLSRTTRQMLIQYRKTNNLRAAIDLLSKTVQGAINKQIAYESAVDRTSGSLVFNSGKLVINTAKQRRAAQAMLRSTSAAEDLIVKYKQQGRSAKFVSGRIDKMRKELIDQAMQMGATREQAQRLIDKYFNIPQKVKTFIKTPGMNKAIGNVIKLHDELGTLEDVYAVKLTGAAGQGQGMKFKAAGGPITGPGGPRGDRIPAMLSNGENVWSARDVQRAGGQSAVEAMKPRFAAGGPVTPEIIVNAKPLARSSGSMLDFVNALEPVTVPQFGGPSRAVADVVSYVQSRAAAVYGWVGAQWTALFNLLMSESGFRPHAKNPISSAYGIFQFLDSTQAAYGIGPPPIPVPAQTTAGLAYVFNRYGGPIDAWQFKQAHNWYHDGSWFTKGGPAILQRGEMVLPREVAQVVRRGSDGAAAPNVSIAVFIGDEEITDRVRVVARDEMAEATRPRLQRMTVGRR